MAEKRKPDLVLLLRFKGNKTSVKVELFKARQWGLNYGITDRYRLRKNGAWFPEGPPRFYTITEVKELVFKGLHRRLRS